MAATGDPIIIRHQLVDGATNRYPLAHVFDSTNQELAGSPVPLSHIARGLYGDNGTLVYPSPPKVRTQVIVYDDGGHTQVDAVEGDGNDDFVQAPALEGAFVGVALYLSDQAIDGDTTAFVQAHLYDATGAELAGSPVNLLQVGRGLYVDNGTFNMPDTPLLAVQYKWFTDSGHTVPHPIHGDGLDLIERAVPSVLNVMSDKSLFGQSMPGGTLKAGG